MVRDFFLPRPCTGLKSFGDRMATDADAAWLRVAVLARLRVPERAPDPPAGWFRSWRLLLPGALVYVWTGDSERSMLPSALASVGIGRAKRDMLGRWGAEGSDAYVRTQKAMVCELPGRFVSAVRSGQAYFAFDEEDACADVRDRLAKRYELTEALRAQIEVLGADAQVAAGDFNGDVGPLELATVVAPDDIPENPGSDYGDGVYIVAYSKGRKKAVLHLASGCWRARAQEFQDYEVLAPAEFATVCEVCWKQAVGSSRWSLYRLRAERAHAAHVSC